MAAYCENQANWKNLRFCSYYCKSFGDAFVKLNIGDLLFCMVGFEGYLDVTAALNSHVTQTDKFRKDFCIANTPDSTVHVDRKL
jgi:hypothetical protein